MVSAFSILGVLVAALLFGMLPVILIIAGHNVISLTGWIGIALPVLLLLALLTASLVNFRGSFRTGFADVIAIFLAVFGWIVSKFATSIRRIGSVISLFTWITSLFGRYLGTNFVEDRREELVERGIKYYEQGDVDIQSEQEELARQTREHYADAGRSLSNGEAFLGIAIAAIALIPSSTSVIQVFPWIQSPVIIAIISSAVVLVVTLRLAALELVLVRDPPVSAHPVRLAVYEDWNRRMSRGTELVQTLLMIRAIHAISPDAYDFFIDWIFERNFGEGSAGKIELLYELRQPIIAFHFADRNNVSPVEAAEDRYGWNVFAEFDFGPGAEDPAPESIEQTTLDGLFQSLLSIKADIRRVSHIVHVHQVAIEEDRAPEVVSRELFGENILRSDEEQDDVKDEVAE